ncbi:hypothetical protein OG552_25130 [Streptomyces sp. NBC_01476]|uniref:hypothetical protein n=1 Tax=Streptomyces sp. NBC_01476 TaxID=2903881 RepID=UPI002E309300|nr:hypothetical protein [Streptomyces sp. NBC_01476]
MAVKPEDIADLIESGVKFSEEDLVATGRAADGRVVFLEKGNSRAGLTHIIERHGAEFEQRGIGSADLPGFIINAVTKGKVVGYQGKGTGRPIYELEYNGSPQRVAVTVGNNGFVVGANPVGSGG